MLEFFRKYQRIFFIIVTGVVICSFSFFGAIDAVTRSNEVEDPIIGTAIDGSPLRRLELQQFSRFLASDAREPKIHRSQTPNYFNDGVIRADFLDTGIGSLLVQHYFDALKEELQTRLSHVKRFRHYTHPQAPQINLLSVWGQFHPELKKEIDAISSEQEVSSAVFDHLAKLYIDQERLPPELTRRILLYHMEQSGVPVDPSIQYADLSLWGYHTMKDWFGPCFFDLAAQFIHNAAAAAYQKGYRVSEAEAKAELLRHFDAAVKKEPHPLTYQQQLRVLGMGEKEAIRIEQKILLFRRLFNGLGDAALLDSLPQKELAEFAGETATIQLFRLPEALSLKTADDLFGFQFYIGAVAVPEKNPLAIPTAYKSIDEVEKKTPELVETVYKGRIGAVSKEKISLRASLKEVLDWQLEHWTLVSQHYPGLSSSLSTREERFSALQKLSPSARSALDGWSRKKIVDLHPEWIDQFFEAVELREKTFSVSSNRVSLALIENHRQFGELLERASAGEAGAIATLTRYSDDGETIYRVEQVEKTADRRIRPFADVKRERLLKELTDRHLEKNYPLIRTKNPSLFETPEGEWKPFSEVKEAVGLALYADVIKAIDAKEKKSDRSIGFYATHRLAEPMRAAAVQFQQSQQEPSWLETFRWVRQEKKIQRSVEKHWMNQEAFLLVPNQWSPVYVPEDGQIVFFYLQEKASQSNGDFQLAAAKETLAKDVKILLFKRLQAEIGRKKGIVIPIQKEEEHV